MNKHFLNGFLKQAAAYGFSYSAALNFLKFANDGCNTKTPQATGKVNAAVNSVNSGISNVVQGVKPPQVTMSMFGPPKINY